MRREQPSGLMLGPGLEEWWRYPVRFPGCASHFFGACWEGVFLDFYSCWGMWGDTFERGWGHFLVGSGSLFRHFWDVLGSVWEWSGDVFRQVLEGFEKNVRPGRTNTICKTNGREYIG